MRIANRLTRCHRLHRPRTVECSLLAESDVSCNYLQIPVNGNYSSEVGQLPVEEDV